MKTVDIKGKDYIPVNERIKYFRENYPNWSLTSEIINIEDNVCIIKAIIKDENEVIKATGLAYEKEGNSFINKTSYIENCETSAWGRALGNLGIGIDTSIASAEEVQNANLNQNKPVKGATTSDYQVYVTLAKIDNKEALKDYYELNKEKVADREGFYNKVQEHLKALKRIEKIDKDKKVEPTLLTPEELEEVPF